MRRRITFIFCALLLPILFFGQVFKEISDPSELIESYISHSENISSIKADFDQEKHTEFLEKPLLTKGLFYSDSEKRFRWEQNGAQPYVMIINDQDAFIFKNGAWETHDLERDRHLRYISELIASIINGQILRSEEYEMTFYGSELQYKVELVPKKERMKKYMSMVTLVLRRSDWLLDGLTIEDGSGNRTVLTFHDQISNAELASSLFSPDN